MIYGKFVKKFEKEKEKYVEVVLERICLYCGLKF